jgi:hypothetical protein
MAARNWATRRDLTMLGVMRRPGATLSFGNIAAAVLESSDMSILFVAS